MTAHRALQETTEELLNRVNVDSDTYWLLFGAILVFFMQAGFGMLEVGLISQKNTKNILVKNVMDACFGAIVYWIFGYGIAFGDASDTHFAGNDNFALSGDAFSPRLAYTDGFAAGSGYNYAFFFFQFAFAATTATIVSGAVAERIRFEAYLVYAVLLIGFVYPVVACMGWNTNGAFSGFNGDSDEVLFGCGIIDFAGSGVVHTTGGVAALTGSIFVGARTGRFGANGEVHEMAEQNQIFATLGTFILWVGWYGFNGVSTLYITGYSAVAAKVMVCTTIAAAAGGLSSLVFAKLKTGVVDLGAALNGVLGGLVSITASCAVVEPYGALIIGLIGGVVYSAAAMLLVALKIDDVVNAAPVHMFCGMWGVFASGFFATVENYNNAYYSDRSEKCAGVFYGGDGSTLAANVCFILAVVAWTGGTCSIMFGLLKAGGRLRLTDAEQLAGMDILEHGGPAWPEFKTTPYGGGAGAAFKAVSQDDSDVAPPNKNPTAVAVSN